MDVDFFKLYNDRYGHQAGDDALRTIAITLKSCLRRPADLVARYGGEEFACILPETSYDDALAMAQELERRIRRLGMPHESSSVDNVVTISVGIATRDPDALGDAQGLIGLADSMLYRAKNTGRGRVLGGVMSAKIND